MRYKKVTVISISALALNCRCLRVLELVYGYRKICHDFLDGLRRDHPRLKIQTLECTKNRRFHLYD